MGLIDDVMDNVRTAATTVSKKTNSFVDYSKLKFTASGLANEIRKKYQTLGEEIYTASKIGTEDSTAVEQLIQEIDALKEQLQITNELITAAKHKITCPVCKAELDRESLFCNKCGTKVEDVPVASTEEDLTEEDEEVVVEDPFKEVVVKSDSDEDADIQD
ncbi:MAG: zinc ribbon domain-containing protein [Ruminococcus sp.]|nr:zinc ribbon domain-containing protein [Ruminococcus sp.]